MAIQNTFKYQEIIDKTDTEKFNVGSFTQKITDDNEFTFYYNQVAVLVDFFFDKNLFTIENDDTTDIEIREDLSKKDYSLIADAMALQVVMFKNDISLYENLKRNINTENDGFRNELEADPLGLGDNFLQGLSMPVRAKLMMTGLHKAVTLNDIKYVVQQQDTSEFITRTYLELNYYNQTETETKINDVINSKDFGYSNETILGDSGYVNSEMDLSLFEEGGGQTGDTLPDTPIIDKFARRDEDNTYLGNNDFTNGLKKNSINVLNESETDALIDTKIGTIPDADLSDYYTKTETDTEIDTKIGAIDLSNLSLPQSVLDEVQNFNTNFEVKWNTDQTASNTIKTISFAGETLEVGDMIVFESTDYSTPWRYILRLTNSQTVLYQDYANRTSKLEFVITETRLAQITNGGGLKYQVLNGNGTTNISYQKGLDPVSSVEDVFLTIATVLENLKDEVVQLKANLETHEHTYKKGRK